MLAEARREREAAGGKPAERHRLRLAAYQAEVLTSTAALRDLVRDAEEQVSPRKRADIERLAVRDHRFHAERRRPAKPDKPAGAPRPSSRPGG